MSRETHHRNLHLQPHPISTHQNHPAERTLGRYTATHLIQRSERKNRVSLVSSDQPTHRTDTSDTKHGETRTELFAHSRFHFSDVTPSRLFDTQSNYLFQVKQQVPLSPERLVFIILRLYPIRIDSFSCLRSSSMDHIDHSLRSTQHRHMSSLALMGAYQPLPRHARHYLLQENRNTCILLAEKVMGRHVTVGFVRERCTETRLGVMHKICDVFCSSFVVKVIIESLSGAFCVCHVTL